MRLLTLSSLLLSTVASILAAPVPVSIGEDGSISVHLLRRTGDKIYRGGVKAIEPKEGELKQDAHGNYIPGGSGISVTANPAMLPHKQAREMTKEDAAKKFDLKHTPTSNDPDHHSLDLKKGQKMTPEQLHTHLNTGWKQTPAEERASHLAAAKQGQNSAQAHSGSHQASGSSHNQAAHTPSNSQQHHAPAAPASPKTDGTTRSWAEVVAGNKPATQHHNAPASKQGGGSQSGSHAGTQGHTTPHQSPGSHAGTPPPASHPSTSNTGHGASHSTSQSHIAPHPAPPAPHPAPPAAHQGTSHATSGSPPTRSWAQVVAAPPTHKAPPNAQSKNQGKKP